MPAAPGFSALSDEVAPATAILSAGFGENGPAVAGSEIVFMKISLLYGSLNPPAAVGSMAWNCLRESDDPITINSPPRVETSAGRLSSRLSVCARNTGPVQALPSNDATCSVHTVPSGLVHQTGCALRTASHSRPDASTVRRGELFFGAAGGIGVADSRRAFTISGFGTVQSIPAPW